MKIKKRMASYRKFVVTNNVKSDSEIKCISERLGELIYTTIEQMSDLTLQEPIGESNRV